MKKLLALLASGALLALTTGCPPGNTTSETRPGGPANTNPTPPVDHNTNPKPPAESTAAGKVKSVEKGKIVITDAKDKDWNLDVSSDAKATLDGKDVAADKIPVGSEVTATTKDGKVTKLVATSTANPNPKPPAETTATGKVKSDEKGKIVITDDKGKDWDLDVAADAKATLDGKDVAADKIPAGSDVTATVKDSKVTDLKATSAAKPNPNPASPPEAKGKVKSIEGDKVVVTDDKGKDWNLTLAPDAKITVDDKADKKASDIKTGADVTATLKDGKITEIKATNPK